MKNTIYQAEGFNHYGRNIVVRDYVPVYRPEPREPIVVKEYIPFFRSRQEEIKEEIPFPAILAGKGQSQKTLLDEIKAKLYSINNRK